MGISLGAFLQNAVTPATQVLAANQGAQADANKQKLAFALQQIALERQAQQTAVENQLKQAQARSAEATAAYRARQASQPVRDPVKDHAAIRDYDVAHPLPSPADNAFRPTSFMANGQPVQGFVKAGQYYDAEGNPVTGKITPYHAPEQPSFTPFQGTDDSGKPVVRPFNTKTGAFGPVADVNPKSTGGVSGSASAQLQQARLMAAVSEARLADERMRAFEDKLLNGSAAVTPLKQSAGSLTSNLSDTHSPIGALMQSGSEFFLNKNDPEYAQYLRDAATIGRAEQMMSPRGGNETMVRANALLSRAGTGAMQNTIEASRMARQALFGQAGGVAQTLSPEQNQKLETGIQRIKSGDHGDVNLGAKPPLATRVIQLKAQGLSKDAARAELVKEGYDLNGAP